MGDGRGGCSVDVGGKEGVVDGEGETRLSLNKMRLEQRTVPPRQKTHSCARGTPTFGFCFFIFFFFFWCQDRKQSSFTHE